LVMTVVIVYCTRRTFILFFTTWETDARKETEGKEEILPPPSTLVMDGHHPIFVVMNLH
jgi:hypothetical protein